MTTEEWLTEMRVSYRKNMKDRVDESRNVSNLYKLQKARKHKDLIIP
jgi:hypothetical protein